MKEDILYGINPVREALRGNRKAFELFVQTGGTDQRIAKLATLAEEKGIAVRRRERADLERLAGNPHHQGVVLKVAPFIYAELEDFLANHQESEGGMFLLVLDRIQDPQNLGALIRSAACAGVQGVIIPKDRACGMTPVVEKASAGAVETIPVIQVTNLVQTLERLKQAGCWIFGLAGEANKDIYQADYRGNLALVVGSEGEGIRPLVRKHCDLLLAIPHYGGISSLNASVAGGIVLFEAARQRCTP
ncbi:23S rRNA (guanosine(2251)-2'-O)-methyltransferase RlmB [Trichlorobacter lovleyi]|uniref:RNA methyltransferase, TrmH family, group 3 n=1 Tax=Trichlorobacter lovleyi (strain ATCC BAA-1151 / DSM 17278 / SZ) TaxID=398767 RepID=B3E1T3_TRIL1|nr:23S rRNA (guanosine(2251)-2'-O)-methyltransferase RlmB [Trichlorobacter lovleyi]ACD95583.1 RNA methyltransferase, TrmH family, group 3 [Trichlorobacter lovleyi SZ]